MWLLLCLFVVLSTIIYSRERAEVFINRKLHFVDTQKIVKALLDHMGNNLYVIDVYSLKNTGGKVIIEVLIFNKTDNFAQKVKAKIDVPLTKKGKYKVLEIYNENERTEIIH
jgi:hypothetical protein